MKTPKTPRITLTLRSADCVTDLLTIRVTARNAVAAAEQVAALYHSELCYGRASSPRVHSTSHGLVSLRPTSFALHTLTAETLVAGMRTMGLAV